MFGYPTVEGGNFPGDVPQFGDMSAYTDKYTVRARDPLHCQLIMQEGKYWRSHPEQLTQSEFSTICERRGFNADEIENLKGLLKFWDVEWAG